MLRGEGGGGDGGDGGAGGVKYGLVPVYERNRILVPLLSRDAELTCRLTFSTRNEQQTCCTTLTTRAGQEAPLRSPKTAHKHTIRRIHWSESSTT